jgi:Ca-activated chloride channel homolog
MSGIRFTRFIPSTEEKSSFGKLSKLFFQLLSYTSGNAGEALDWMNQLDRQYNLTDNDYGMGDFIEDLKRQGYLSDDPGSGEFRITAKSEQTIRKNSLEEIFGKLKRSNTGNHKTSYTGQGDEPSSEIRPYQFGDRLDSINITASIHNAQINHGIDDFKLTQDDLEIQEREQKSQTSTVLMIDISHSMILYGQDHSCQEGSNGIIRAYPDQISQRHT